MELWGCGLIPQGPGTSFVSSFQYVFGGCLGIVPVGPIVRALARGDALAQTLEYIAKPVPKHS